MSLETGPIEETMLDSEPAAVDDKKGEAKLKAEPVASGERVETVDMLRGFAVLGILAMNIVDFGWGWSSYNNPEAGGGFSGTNRFVWVFNHLFFDMKMMTLFSMLFGAGLVLMGDRADKRGASLRGVYYRRVLWLLAIGLIHSYLIWAGDILVLYAECGLFLYLFRRKSSRTLIALGTAALLMAIPLVFGLASAVKYLKVKTPEVARKAKEGEKLTLRQQFIADYGPQILEELAPDPNKLPKKIAEERQLFRGNYLGIVRERAKVIWIEQTVGFLLFGWMEAGGRMLIGMGLMKLGVLSGERSRRFYLILMLVGYGVGLTVLGIDTALTIRHRFAMEYMLRGGFFFNFFGSVLVALGHVGAWILIRRSGVLNGMTARLASAGRMALTNYLTQSIVCSTLFYGYGFGLFARVDRTGLVGIVLLIWTFQLWFSPIWLSRFRYGPVEWLWRSLTYWKIQPLRA